MNIEDFALKEMDHLSLLEITEKQIEASLSYSRQTRSCHSLSDKEFILAGLSRLYSAYQSGRDFLQSEEEINGKLMARSTFFDALQSPRRQKLLEDIHGIYIAQMNLQITGLGCNYLREFPELDNYDVYCADGHFIQHSCHSEKSKKGKAYAPGSIYGMNMKTATMLFMASVADGSCKSHEMPKFKSYLNENPPDKPRIWVVDRAYVDGIFWYKQKKKKQYTISLLKENIKNSMQTIAEFEYDKNNPVNSGVTAYYLAATGSSISGWRIIEYTDPETLEEYTFYTTLDDENIQPGVIAWLYFKRWNIEKVYDNFKNSMHVKKAWGKSLQAQTIQACLTVMTYNLIRLIIETLRTEGHEDEKVAKKYQRNLQKRAEIAQAKERTINPLLIIKNRIARISQQVIRSIQNAFCWKRPYSTMRGNLIRKLRAYI